MFPRGVRVGAGCKVSHRFPSFLFFLSNQPEVMGCGGWRLGGVGWLAGWLGASPSQPQLGCGCGWMGGGGRACYLYRDISKMVLGGVLNLFSWV